LIIKGPGGAVTDLRKVLRVRRAGFALSGVDPRSTPGLPDTKAVRKDPKKWAAGELMTIGAELASYQERLFAGKDGASPQRVLLLLQSMDCGGKDGTVSHVLHGLNPTGIRATSFGPPDEQERRHDFLWRIRRALPPAGYLGVFNRSQYEDVLIARVHSLVAESEWSQRYDLINQFEQEQAESGLTMVKVMLHLSPEEQRERLLARLDDPTKRWKYNPGDLTERARWADYQAAYQDALTRCSTDRNPWHVVPADRKWYRNWAVATLLRETFADLDPQYPVAGYDVATERERVRTAR
jgi:PPK2 family polyphosphate:nucleotide phosphotransferase